MPAKQIIAASAAILAVGAGTAAAAVSDHSKMAGGKSGVNVVDPPDTVKAGRGRNVEVGVHFTQAAKKAGVRAVVVKLQPKGGDPRDHAGKVIFRPGGSAFKFGALTAHNAGSYTVRYEVMTGKSVSNGARHTVNFPVTVQPAG